MSRLALRVRYAACLGIPLIAVWAASYVAESRPAVSSFASWGWLHLGLAGVGLALLIAPIVLQRLLHQSRDTLKTGGIQVEQLLLLVVMGATAASSMTPVILMSLRVDAGRFVLPWAAICIIWQALWLWRLRRAL